jgi:AcrR family transcriptional regulator
MRVTLTKQTNLRTRKRLESMRRVQAAALDLFERHGFERVTIEQIAGAAEVGPATVYRHFGTKERVVLWDEYDPGLFDAIAARLRGTRPERAVRDALIAELARVYDEDRARILRRARLMQKTPALETVLASDAVAMRRRLAWLFLSARACRDRLEADVAAGAVVATLEAGIAEWVRRRGRTALGEIMTLAFRRLES